MSPLELVKNLAAGLRQAIRYTQGRIMLMTSVGAEPHTDTLEELRLMRRQAQEMEAKSSKLQYQEHRERANRELENSTGSFNSEDLKRRRA